MREIDVGYKDDMGLMLQMFGVIITDLKVLYRQILTRSKNDIIYVVSLVTTSV